MTDFAQLLTKLNASSWDGSLMSSKNIPPTPRLSPEIIWAMELKLRKVKQFATIPFEFDINA